MQDIRRVLKAAAIRLYLADLLKTSVVTLTIALALMVVFRVVQKLTPVPADWAWVFAGAGAGAILAAVVWSAMRRAKGIDVAREVDERAGLRESISTALCVENEDSAWSRNIVDQAVEKARGVNVREAIPVTTPRLWPAVLAGAIALLTVWWLPNYDVAGMFAKKQAADEQEREIREVLGEVKSGQKKLEELLSKTSVDLDEEGDDEAADGDAQEPAKADEIRRQAIKKLTKISDQIKKAQDSDEARKLEALRQSLSKLREPTDTPASEFSRALARGNFADAKQELEKLAEQLSADELTDPEKKAAQAQLQKMAQQMEALAQARKQLEQQLQDAGLSEQQAQQAARDPSQLEQMLQNMPGIPSDLANQLRQSAQAQQSASEAMQSMSQSLQQMAQNMSQDGEMSQQAQQAMQDMASQLSNMEMSQSEAEALESAMSEIQNQMQQMSENPCEGGCTGECGGQCDGSGKTGQFQEGDSENEGSGSGGGGQGWAASPEGADVDFILDKRKEKVENQGGPIIGSTLVFGDQIRGDSVAQFEQATTAARAEAAEAIETRQIPREYEKAIQHYFGRLEARAKAKRAGQDSGESTED